MKKRIYFILSSIIGIINLIYANIIKVDELIKEEVSSAENLVNKNTLNILSNPTFYYIIAIIGIIIFLSIMYIYFRNKEIKYRTYLITITIILLFISSSSLILLISLIDLYFISTIPKTLKLKETMPILEKDIINKKDIIKSIIIIIVYYFINFFLGDILALFIDSNLYNMVFNILSDIFLLSLVIILFYHELLNGFKILFKNIKSYSNFILKNYGLLLLSNIGCSLIIMLLTGDVTTSQNQVSLNKLPLWYLFPAACIYAPLVEETVFRGCLRKLIKNDKLFLIISALSFGLLHTIGQEKTILNTILYALPYIAMGFVLAYSYKKSNNISTNITLHFLNNFLSCLITSL